MKHQQKSTIITITNYLSHSMISMNTHTMNNKNHMKTMKISNHDSTYNAVDLRLKEHKKHHIFVSEIGYYQPYYKMSKHFSADR